MAGKLLTLPRPARPVSAGTLRLRRACAASGLTQAELGALIGVDDSGVRKRLRVRVRPDRLDLLDAIETHMARRKAA